MSRIVNGSITIRRNLSYNADLVTAGVVRCRSGTKGFVRVRTLEDLELYFSDALNIESLRLLVSNQIPLELSVPTISNPDYSMILTPFSNLPVVYIRSDLTYTPDDINLVDITQEGLGDLIIKKGYCYAYKLTKELKSGDYISIPIEDRWCLIYVGALPPITLNNFSMILHLDEFSWDGLMDLINDPSRSNLMRAYRTPDGLSIHTIQPHKYDTYSNVEGFSRDEEEDHRLMACSALAADGWILKLTSEIYGPRYSEMKIKFEKINLSSDYLLSISLGNYTESFRINPSVGNLLYIGDVLLDSKLLAAELVGDVNRLPSIVGSYEFLLPQKDIPSDLESIKSAWSDLPEDALYYLAIDDGLNSESYLKWLESNFTNVIDNSVRDGRVNLTVMGYLTELNQEFNKRVILFSQKVLSKGVEYLPWVFPIIWIYDQRFVGDISGYLLEGTNGDSDHINQYFEEDYLVFTSELISADGTTPIVQLITDAFVLRMHKYMRLLISQDSNFEVQILSWISTVLQQCPMISKAELISCEMPYLHQLKVKISLELKEYKSGTIIINFIINA